MRFDMGSAMQLRLGMLVWGWLLLLAGLFGGLVPVASSAQPADAGTAIRPAEEPPSDFSGAQYIDSTGCVFLRAGKVWQPRLSHDAAPACGYPPTPVGTATAHDIAASSPPPFGGMSRIKGELVTAVAANLAPGELVGDPRQPPSAAAANAVTPRPRRAGESEDGTASEADQIAAALEASAPIRAATAGSDAPNTRLCRLLGLPTASAGSALGPDPTGGFCGGPTAANLMRRVARAEAVASVAGSAHAPAPAEGKAGAAASGHPAHDRGSDLQARAPARSATDARHASSTSADARGAPALKGPAQPKSRVEVLIPAGARYLQVLRTEDPTTAEAALSRLHAIGLPVVQERGSPTRGQVLLAGPFPTRQAIVLAHDRLTRAGFRNLLPR